MKFKKITFDDKTEALPMDNIFKLFIRNYINLFGYDLVKFKSLGTKILRLDATKAESPIKVEFIGPSGVGKSAVFEELVRVRKGEDTWITVNEFLRPLQNNSFVKDAANEYDVLLDVYLKLMSTRSLSIRKKYKLLGYYLKVITEDEMVNNFAGEQIVVFPESMFHNGSHSIMELEKINPEIFKQLIQKRVVVNCMAQPETILEYIKKRNGEGRLRVMHEGLTDSELMMHVKYSLDVMKELMRLLIDYDVPCIEINTADNITENAHKVRNFIKSLVYEKNA